MAGLGVAGASDENAWRRRGAVLAAESARRDELDVHKQLAADALNALLSGRLDNKGVETFHLQYQQSLRRIVELLYPWLQKSEDASTTEQALINTWNEAWGDPNDPVTAAKIAKTVEFLMS